MIPFKDDNPTSTFPFVTISLIVTNTIVFILQITSPANPVQTAHMYGAIPNYLLNFSNAQSVHPVFTIFTSMFMHGGFIHLGSNMLYLWIFGDNIEDKLGHARFLLFYILCGVAAVYSHALADPSSVVPMIGASGAVSGILGAYLLLYPRARVHTLIFLLFFVQVVRLPALYVIGIWILIQFASSLMSTGTGDQNLVAWFAHIGGFVFGILMIIFYMWSKGLRLYKKRTL